MFYYCRNSFLFARQNYKKNAIPDTCSKPNSTNRAISTTNGAATMSFNRILAQWATPMPSTPIILQHKS